MENRRPYWQVCVRLLFSLLATAAFVIVCWKLIGFLMPFVIGWIIASIASPLVNWLVACKLAGEKTENCKKTGISSHCHTCTGIDCSGSLSGHQPACCGNRKAGTGFSGDVCPA